VRVTVNGTSVEFSEQARVADAVREAGYDTGSVGLAVAVDGEVIPRSEWPSRPIAGGQRIEVLRPAAGGAGPGRGDGDGPATRSRRMRE